MWFWVTLIQRITIFFLRALCTPFLKRERQKTSKEGDSKNLIPVTNFSLYSRVKIHLIQISTQSPFTMALSKNWYADRWSLGIVRQRKIKSCSVVGGLGTQCISPTSTWLLTVLVQTFITSPWIIASSTLPLCTSRKRPLSVYSAAQECTLAPQCFNYKLLSLLWSHSPTFCAALIPASVCGTPSPRGISPPSSKAYLVTKTQLRLPSFHEFLSVLSNPYLHLPFQAEYLFLSGVYVLQFCPFN